MGFLCVENLRVRRIKENNVLGEKFDNCCLLVEIDLFSLRMNISR